MPEIETWYLAVCLTCTPLLPMPFIDRAERDEWAVAHRDGTGHAVHLTEERR